MREWTLPVVIVFLVAALAGCGQKGPLYRSAPETAPGPAGQAVSAETQDQRPDDRDSNAE